jgi:hypothetical protein
MTQNSQARGEQERDARLFLETLFEQQPPKTVIAIGDARKPHFVLSPADALAWVVGKSDVYVRMSLLAGKPATPRGKKEDSVAILGVWADIDVEGGPKSNGKVNEDGAESVEAARRAAYCVLEPTLLVQSGFGVHGHWLFEDPWVLGDERERQAAAELVQGWQNRLRHELSFSLDHKHDLTTLLRVPGSLNGKLEQPAPVVLASSGGPRYQVDEIGQLAIRPQRRRSTPPASENVDARTPEELLERYRKLATIARREGKAPGDGSGHVWDYKLACEARRTVTPPITEAEAVALVAHARGMHPDEKRKGERTDYLENTVAKAFDAVGDNIPVTPASAPSGIESALRAMSEVVGIAQHGVQFTSVRIVGQLGMRASVDLELSNDERLYFASMRELTGAKTLGLELTFATGFEIVLDDQAVRRFVALLRTAAERIQSMTDDEVATDWADYLRGAEHVPVDMADQQSRWQAFARLRDIEASLVEREVARAVLDDDGVLYVRSSWFCDHVRRHDPHIGTNARIIEQMRRLGWQRRGTRGYIKATDPDGTAKPILWAFLIVASDWEDTMGGGE